MVAEKGKMLLEIVAPSRQVVRSEHVDEVIAPGSEGEFGVLPGHTPFLATLRVGMLSYREGADWHHLAVEWGYAEVGPDRVVILAEGADRAADIDLSEARIEKDRAERLLAEKLSEKDYEKARIDLMRAMIRIQVAEKHGQK
ncbi:MAG: F0F1 ATP synthase subunit epsilon [Nitrospirae bacterium]|jgi:F-type H+-transporting ATPase subunit epsilon|nr:F0F1 ATP synthase subunit epsilon [Nitrospirota bacterium]NTW65698.1 F0F1 ATP synthase subunit epsilon [Nitrospirota bacterium]